MLAVLLLLAASHRPLAGPSALPLGEGPHRYADAARGDDTTGDGTEAKPWKTLSHAAGKLRPGDTLVLRGGVYHEHVVLSLKGTPEKPITVRSRPGERAVLDGGYPEFLEGMAKAWEPAKGGVAGEFVSTRKYPDLAGGKKRRNVAVLGNFATDMVPLHGYRFRCDLRSSNPYWTLKNKVGDDPVGVWCGPGVWFDPDTQRIHCRLSPSGLKLLGEADYKGGTDPRMVSLVVAGGKSVVHLENACHLRLLDITLRGSAGATLSISDSSDLRLEGLHVYSGSPAVSIRATTRLSMSDSAVRGLSAPWSSRASQKYRGISAYLFVVSGGTPGCSHFEIQRSEFTDSHDGLVLGTMSHLDFHHNRVDRIDDDGIYLTTGRPRPPEGIVIRQNVLSRCLTTFAHAGGKGEVGPGVFICRNVIDLRRGTASTPPASAKEDVPDAESWNREGRVGGDHGSPTWESQFFYHNTVLTAIAPWRDVYAAGMASHTAGTKRRVFNNLIVHAKGKPGATFPRQTDDFDAGGNLHWSLGERPGDLFAKWRATAGFKVKGWGKGDIVADPLLESLERGDMRLRAGSPALGAGVAVPKEWPDPLRGKGAPDIGAIPAGAAMLKAGLR